MTHTARSHVALLSAVPLLLTVGSLTAACAGEGVASEPRPDPVTVEVETVDWNGWDQGDQPQPAVRTVSVSEGTTFRVSVLGGEVEFSVTDVDEHSIGLESDQAMAPTDPGGGFDLDAPDQEFTLTGSEPLELVTPTLDAGTSVTLTVR